MTSHERRRAWDEAKNILCVRLDSLGDVLMTSPALRALKAGRPDRRITLLASPSGTEAAKLLPDIDDVFVYGAPWMKALGGAPAADGAMIETLREPRFDAAVIFTAYSQSPLPAALMTYLAGIPLRAAHCRENPYHLLTDWFPEQEPERFTRHEVRRQIDLVAGLRCPSEDVSMRISIPEAGRRSALQKLFQADLDLERPWVAVHAGASAPSRRYEPEGFAAVCRRLVRDEGLQIVLTGSGAERGLTEAIQAAAAVPSINLAGQLDVEELAAVIDAAPLLVSNNTGPAHIAAAAGTPVVVLYALTNPQHTPWQVPSRVLFHDVPCRNCYKSVCPEGHHNCLRLVRPEEVVRAATDLLKETQTSL